MLTGALTDPGGRGGEGRRGQHPPARPRDVRQEVVWDHFLSVFIDLS